MRGKHDKECQGVKPFHILGDVALTGERSAPVDLDAKLYTDQVIPEVAFRISAISLLA